MDRPIKRPCPCCGGISHVVKSTNLQKTTNYVERIQDLKCLSCGAKGILITKEYIDWTCPNQDLGKSGEYTRPQVI